MDKTKRRYAPSVLIWAALLTACFLLGSAGGCLFAGMLTEDSALQIGTYLSDYLALAGEGGIEQDFVSLLWHHVKWVPVCLMLSMTRLGVVMIPMIFLVRGFGLSYAVGCFFRFIPDIGLFMGLCFFGLPALLWCPALMLLGSISLNKSRQRIRMGRGELGGLFPGKVSCRKAMALTLVLLLLCALTEYLLIPRLIEIIP